MLININVFLTVIIIKRPGIGPTLNVLNTFWATANVLKEC